MDGNVPVSSSSRADVAVYAPFAEPLYSATGGATGGAELQSGYLAWALAGRGYRVRHVVCGGGPPETKDGVEVVRIGAGYSSGGLARRRAIIAALRDADARVYIQRSAGFETGIVGAYARVRGRRFVFSSSSVADFSRDPLVARDAGASLDEWPSRRQYLLGLRLAHVVVAQTEEQRELARTDRHVEARVIPSFCELGTVVEGRRDAFLWVGAATPVKDPLAYVELAAAVPEARFRMIAPERGAASAPLTEAVRRRAAVLPNLEFLPAVSRAELLELYASAVAVVNTSLFEGFPNAFLEGWARGVPALSLRVDPDGVIARHGLGAACAGSAERLAAEARRLWEAGDGVDRAALRAYVESRHDPGIVGVEWAALVEELLSA